MSWQDIVVAVSVLAFNIALIPSVLGKQKPRLATSITTALFLIPQIIAFVSLELWYASAMAFINAGLWVVLALQQMRRNRIATQRRK